MNIDKIKKDAPQGADGYRMRHSSGKYHIRYYKTVRNDVYAWNFRKWVKVVNKQSTWTIKPL